MVDNILVLKHGRITETGTYEDLVNKQGPFAEFVTNYLREVEELETTDTECK